jgi:carboxy-cis,cis-muconate cyclase
MKTEPYYVFSVTWPSPSACGAAYSTHSNGTIDDIVDIWSYARESGAHGLALGERNGQPVLYTADLNGDSLWTHAIDRTSGKAKELGRLKLAKTGLHPRHVAAHPSGKYVYLIMEAENTIHQIDLDGKTGVGAKDNKAFSVIPDGRSHTPSSDPNLFSRLYNEKQGK